MSKEYKFEFRFIDINPINNQDKVMNTIDFQTTINIQNDNPNEKIQYYEKLINKIDKEIKDYKLLKIIQNKSIFGNVDFLRGFYKDLDDFIKNDLEGLLIMFDDFIAWVKTCFMTKGVDEFGNLYDYETFKYDYLNYPIGIEMLRLINLEIITTLNNLLLYKSELKDKIMIIKYYLLYISYNDELNFDNCFLEPLQAIAFSRYIEKNDIKLIYLNHILNVFENKQYKDTEYLEAEIKKIEACIKLKNDKPIYNKPEESNPEQKQISKPLNKLTLLETEENIILLFNLLNQTGFISEKDYINLGKILQDTFLNSKGKPFVNTQINKVKTTALDTKKLTEKKNLNLMKLYRELKKLIPD